MSEFHTLFICNCIVRAVAFICITVATIHFGRIGVLWFYLIPMFMGVEYKSGKESEDTE